MWLLFSIFIQTPIPRLASPSLNISSHSTHHLILTLPYLPSFRSLHCTAPHTNPHCTHQDLARSSPLLPTPPQNHTTNTLHTSHESTQHLTAVTIAHPTLHPLTSSITARSAYTYYTFYLQRTGLSEDGCCRTAPGGIENPRRGVSVQSRFGYAQCSAVQCIRSD